MTVKKMTKQVALFAEHLASGVQRKANGKSKTVALCGSLPLVDFASSLKNFDSKLLNKNLFSSFGTMAQVVTLQTLQTLQSSLMASFAIASYCRSDKQLVKL